MDTFDEHRAAVHAAADTAALRVISDAQAAAARTVVDRVDADEE